MEAAQLEVAGSEGSAGQRQFGVLITTGFIFSGTSRCWRRFMKCAEQALALRGNSLLVGLHLTQPAV